VEVVAAVMAPRSMAVMVDRAAVPAVSLGRRQVLARLVRVTMVVLLALMRLRIAALVVVVLLPLDRTVMRAVALAVRVTPTTVRHTPGVVAAVQRMWVALPAAVALAALVATALRRLATLVQLARDLVVVVPAALASERPRLRVAQAAMEWL
jgi:hypothetical protein